MQDVVEKERNFLMQLKTLEDLADKKIRIFSRLLMDAELAKQLEVLSFRHEKRKLSIAVLLGEKVQKTDTQESGEGEK